MKIMTWNIHKNPDVWNYINEEIKPDICFLQEYHKNADFERPKNMKIIHNTVTKKPGYWDTVVAAKNCDLKEIEFNKYPGRVQVGKVTFQNKKKILVINIHSQTTRWYSYVTWSNKLLDKLDHIISKNKANLVIGGDLNMGICFDGEGCTHNRDLIERLESYGLTMYPRKETVTYRHMWNLKKLFPDDYLFISKRWKGRCKVLKNIKISDHYPVVVTLRTR